MIRRFDGWVFAPGDPRRLAALRIGLCLVVAARVARPLFVDLAGQPAALFRPRSFMHLFDAMPGRATTVAILIATVALLLAAAAGFGSRVTLPLGWAGATFLFGMETSLGKLVHHDILPLLAMIPLLPASTGGAWSLGRRGGREPSVRDGWPVRLSGLLVGGAYLVAGLSKLTFTGPAWVLGDNLRNILYTASDAHGGNELALFVADRPWLASVVAASALLFELTLWVALVRPRLAFPFVVWAAALHTGIWLTIGINYVSWAATVAIVFPDWPSIVDRIRGRTVVRASRPYADDVEREQHVIFYDEDCGFCRWSLERLLRRDRHGRLRAAPIQSDEGDRALSDLSEEQRLASWHLVTPEGRRYSGGAAAAPMARLLPAGAPVAFLADAFPRTTDRLYRWVADHRDVLGRRLGEQACSVDPSRRSERPRT